MSEKIIVTVNEARFISIPLGHPEMGRDDAVIRLQPGANLVDAKQWEEAAKLPMVGNWLRTKTSNKEEDVAGRMMIEVGHGLPALDAAGADKVLRDTFDEQLLVRWAEEEKRPGVHALIVGRQNEIARIKTQAREQDKLRGGDDKPGKRA